MPPPEPRSSTVSPGLRSATATGFPHPRLAARASAGSSAFSSASYSDAPKFSSTLTAESPQPQPAPCSSPQQPASAASAGEVPQQDDACSEVTARAAEAYRARTCSRSSSVPLVVVAGSVIAGGSCSSWSRWRSDRAAEAGSERGRPGLVLAGRGGARLVADLRAGLA